jgi:hypothetical protein
MLMQLPPVATWATTKQSLDGAAAIDAAGRLREDPFRE